MDYKKSKKLREAVFGKFNGRCAYCGQKLTKETFTVDHITPRRRHLSIEHRGTNNENNLYPCCKSCNCSKGVYSLEKWRSVLEDSINQIRSTSAKYNILERFGLVKYSRKNIVFYFEKMNAK